MVEIVIPLAQNPDMERALLPQAKAADLMAGTGGKANYSEKHTLTLHHEAGHAVLATVLFGFTCEQVSVARDYPFTKTLRVANENPRAGSEDLVDLAALYAEVQAVASTRRMELAHLHITNATHDLDKARRRLSGSTADEVRWAQRMGPLAEQAVRHLWKAIEALAARLGKEPELNGESVRSTVLANLPQQPVPVQLRDLFRGEFRT